MNKKRINIIGQKNGYLTVIGDGEPHVCIKKDGSSGRTFRTLRCECVCGKIKDLLYSHVRSGKMKSCGCKRFEKPTYFKHGKSNHPLHVVWTMMLQRCYNTSASSYKNYGGKGITVCDEWRDDFMAFYNWAIGNGWEFGMDIDKDIKARELGICPAQYSPLCCSVVSKLINQRNKVNAIIIEYGGRRLPLSSVADELRIEYSCVYRRYKKGDRGDVLLRESSKKHK